jgi:hypothetical protein
MNFKTKKTLIVLLLLLSPFVSEAKTGQISMQEEDPLANFWNWEGHLPGTGKNSGWIKALGSRNVTISYNVEVRDKDTGQIIPDNSIVSIGTKIKLSILPHTKNDIYWFGTGYGQDSPYGEWKNGAPPPEKVNNKVTCEEKDLVTTMVAQYIHMYENGVHVGCEFDRFNDIYIPLVVSPPNKFINQLATNLQCGSVYGSETSGFSKDCTVIGNGDIDISFKFSETFGKFYYRYYDYGGGIANMPSGCFGNNVPLEGILKEELINDDCQIGISSHQSNPYTLEVPEKEITYKLKALPPPTVNLIANPKRVYTAASSTLSWSATNADSCTKTMVTSGNLGDSTWSGTAGAAGDKSTKVYTTPGTYVYKISCGGNQYFATTSVEVIPALNAPTVTLLANPSTINGLYTSSIISWVSTDSDLCTKSMVTTGDYNDSGWPLVSNTSKSGEYTSISYSKNGTYTYKIRCTGAGGTAEATTSVLVDAPPLAPPTVTLIANPTNTILGNSSSLVWSSTNAFSCEKSMITRGSYNDSTWSGTTGPGGNQRTKTYVDVGTYTYEIECTGYFGKASTTASVTVSSSTVPDIPGGGSAVTVSLTANPSSVVVGNTSTLSWSSTNANSCAQTMKVGEDDSWNKNNVITLDSQNTRTYTSPGSYTYEITCIGNSGSASATADVTVTNTPIVCEERESCDPEGPCDIATNTQVYECYKESITPGCTVDGTPYNKTNTCVTTVNIYPTCEAQYELETFGKVFVGKRMNWHVSNISPPGTYTVRYKLDPPMSSFAQTDININNSFNIYNTYTYVGTKNFNLEIEMIDYANSIRYVGLCSTSTVAVPYDGTVVER